MILGLILLGFGIGLIVGYGIGSASTSDAYDGE